MLEKLSSLTLFQSLKIVEKKNNNIKHDTYGAAILCVTQINLLVISRSREATYGSEKHVLLYILCIH